MKKFTKLMLSAAAITTVSAAMAISAMAADTITGTYAKDTGIVTLDGVVSSGDQQTLLVLTEDAPTVTEGIIAQIDQDASISSFVLTSGLESGTYYIRIGGTNGKIQTGTLTISSGGGDVETVTLKFGDIDQDMFSFIDAGDVTQLARINVGSASDERITKRYKVVSGADLETIIFGDIDQDMFGFVDAGDVTELAKYNVGSSSSQLIGKSITVESTPLD